jgi:hypothetical protein
MFKKNNKKKFSKLLEISEEEFEDFSKRFLYFLRSKKEFGKNEIMEGFFILEEMKKAAKEEEEAKIKINFGTLKNRYVKKYGYEILQLRKKEGIGAILISKDLYTNHRVSVSKTTIQKFLNLNKDFFDG